MGRFSFSTTIDAPKARVWEVLADFTGTYRWNPSVVESHSIPGPETGLGAGRKCDLGKGHWTEERIVGWEDGKQIELSIVNSNVPISSAFVTLSAVPLTPQMTQVDLTIKYRLKYGPIGLLMDLLLVRREYRKVMRDLLAGLSNYLKNPLRNLLAWRGGVYERDFQYQ